MGANTGKFRSRQARLQLEHLESRQLLSGFQPTAAEQLFLEDLNDARANPAAYGASIGIDLSGVAPSQPLAFNPQLIQAARLHSQDMNDQGYFAHISPIGEDPGQRMTDAGFAWTSWGESIAGGTAFPGPAEALSGLIIDTGVPDLGHRRQLLAIDAIYQNQNQVGIGIVQNGTGPLVDYYTVDSAAGLNASGPFLTGVVFNDANANGKYDIGEGLGGVTITVAGVGSTTTWASGGYSFAVAPGTYSVTASGGGLAAPMIQTVAVGFSNSRLDFAQGDQQYVVSLYQTILGRTPSSQEIVPWVGSLNGPLGRAGVTSAIEHSTEARTRLVRGWYQTYLGRAAANGEELYWVNAMQNGATEEDIMSAILGSTEFYNRSQTLGTGTANARYIKTLYSMLLHRNAGSNEVNIWLQILPGAGTNAVAADFLRSVEYRSDVVASYYSTILHRAQSPLSTEIAGWAATALDITSIRVGFESSAEFFLDSRSPLPIAG